MAPSPLKGLAALMLALLALASTQPLLAEGQVARHPALEEEPSLPGVEVDASTYACMALMASHSLIEVVSTAPLLGASRESATVALRLADMLLAASEGAELESLRARYSPYLLAALSLTISGDPLLSREAGFRCGELSIRGPVGALALTLALAVRSGDSYLLLPLTDDVKIGGAAEGGRGADRDAVNVPLDDRIAIDEIAPPEAYEGGAADTPRLGEVGAAPGPGEAVAEAPGPGSGLAIPGDAEGSSVLPALDVREYVETLFRALGVSGAREDGGAASGGGSLGGIAPAPLGESIGNIIIDYRLLAELSELLGEAGVEAASGGVEIGVYAPPADYSFKPPGLGLPAAALAAAGLVALAYSRREAVARALSMLGVRRLRAPHPVEECYREALEVLEARGLGRMPWETAREHFERVKGLLDPLEAEALKTIVSVYEAHAYSGRKAREDDVVSCLNSLEVLKS